MIQWSVVKKWHGYQKSGGRVTFNCWSAESYITSLLVRLVAALHGITMPVTGEEIAVSGEARTTHGPHLSVDECSVRTDFSAESDFQTSPVVASLNQVS